MIPEHISKNFNTLAKAFKNGNACIMEVKDKESKDQYVICIHQHNEEATDGKTEEFTPIARVFQYTEEDNPYELFTSPT